MSGPLATFSVWDKPQSKQNQTCEGWGLKWDQAGNRYPKTIIRVFKELIAIQRIFPEQFLELLNFLFIWGVQVSLRNPRHLFVEGTHETLRYYDIYLQTINAHSYIDWIYNGKNDFWNTMNRKFLFYELVIFI